MKAASQNAWFWLAAGLVLLYCLNLTADSISGLFGVYWDDEGGYFLSAKNVVLFGTAHLFEGDQWRPELLAPLLHYFGILTITANDPILWARLGMVLCVISGAALIARICGRMHNSAAYALACFICILLNPVLFFYSRIVLSEGLQFLVCAFILYALFELYIATAFSRALIFSGLAGAFVALLFIAKISAIAACAGFSLGALSAIYLSSSPRKWLLVASYATAALAVLGLYFGVALYGQWDAWWHANIAMNAKQRVPQDAIMALKVLKTKLSDIMYYLCLMPIFALYFISLIAGAGRDKGFVRVVWCITLAIVVLESFLGGDLRRNFFSLAMLGVLAGFVCLDYIRSGIGRIHWRNPAHAVGILVVALHGYGAIYLLAMAIAHADMTYIVFGGVFSLLLAIGLVTAFTPHASLRRLLAGLAVACSLMPMGFQAFFAPHTRQDIARDVQRLMPEDAVMVSSLGVWFLPELQRKNILTNCIHNSSYVDFANDPTTVPAFKKRFYMTGFPPGHKDPCAPADITQYKLVGEYMMFNPLNHGGWVGNSARWKYNGYFAVYEKTN